MPCEYVAGRPWHLTRHLQSCDGLSRQQRDTQKETCEKCGQIFTTKKRKERHKRRAKYGEKQQRKITAGETVQMYQYRKHIFWFQLRVARRFRMYFFSFFLDFLFGTAEAAKRKQKKKDVQIQ